jgi:hypothetical protein
MFLADSRRDMTVLVFRRTVAEAGGVLRRGVLAVSLLPLVACSASAPPLAESVLPISGATSQVRAVYVAPVSDDCAYADLLGVAATGEGLVLAENTCAPEAGSASDDSQPRLVSVTPGSVQELPLPPGIDDSDGLRVLAASADGDVYLRTDETSLVTTLWRRVAGGGWEMLSAPAQSGSHHTGDGGPVSEAVIEDPQGVELGDDGSVYVLEPHAVRRIAPDGIIDTITGSDNNDPTDLSEFVTWGSGGVGWVVPDPRALPAGPVTATEFPLPRLTAMDVAKDGTVWLASHDAVLRLGRDGTLVVHADAVSTTPSGAQSRLVGSRGSASSITDIVTRGSALLLVDSWSSRVLRLEGQQLTLVLGRPEEERGSCPQPVLGEPVPATRVCAGSLIEQPDGSVLVTHYSSVLAVPTERLEQEESLG